jgi:hypothetical protein
MQLSFGKYQGQEVEDIVKTQRGREYLQWLVDQPIKPGKWEKDNLERNNYIKGVLADTPKEESPEITDKVTSTLLQAIIEVLERIEENQRKLMTNKGIVWDE